MFIVQITFTTKPAESANLEQAAQKCVDLARQTQGCLAYAFLGKLNQDNTYVLYEEWESQSDFEEYKASPVFKEVGDILTPFLAGAPVNEYFNADKVEL